MTAPPATITRRRADAATAIWTASGKAIGGIPASAVGPQELGYRKGMNMILEYRSADGRAERLPQLAAELVRASPDVLIAGYGTLAPKAAIAATSSIPIVFTSVGDPVGAGLIASLSQPGANATGLSAQASDITAKRLQFLEDLIPGKKLVDPMNGCTLRSTANDRWRSARPR